MSGAMFTPPFRRKDTPKGHHYVDAAGRRVPGVTTIIDKGVPKKALINWSANTTAGYAVDHWDELGEMPPSVRLKELTGARYAAKDLAAGRGTEVHRYAEKLLHGETVNVPEELAGYVEACARFLDEFKFIAEYVEFAVASYTHGYAGTGDWIGTIQLSSSPRDVPPDWAPWLGQRIRLLGDWKTNRTGIFGETALQLSGYRFADRLLLPNNTSIPMPEVDACAALHVRSDGYSLVPVAADRDVHRTLLYVQQVARFTDDSRDYVGPAVPAPFNSPYRLTREQNQ